MTYFDCCEHCDRALGGMHPMALNQHIGPCPHGCNDEGAGQ